MIKHTLQDPFLSYRKHRRENVLRKMALMRAAKERKRIERGPLEREPKMERTTCLSWAVKDDITGCVVWQPLKSARDTFLRVTILLRHYKPGFPI